MQIIERIAVKGPLTFSEAVAELGLPASSTHNHLQTHALRNYLLLDPGSAATTSASGSGRLPTPTSRAKA